MNIKSGICKKIYFLLLFVAGFASVGSPQDSRQDKKVIQRAAMKTLIESKNYDFIAETVIPQGGRSRQLTSGYDLKVSKELLACYLPYFGTAYTAPIDASDGGIHFNSKDFEYSILAGKKTGWNIKLRPRDVSDIQQMNLSISADGYGSLQIISSSRQPIFFYGSVTSNASPKPK